MAFTKTMNAIRYLTLPQLARAVNRCEPSLRNRLYAGKLTPDAHAQNMPLFLESRAAQLKAELDSSIDQFHRPVMLQPVAL